MQRRLADWVDLCGSAKRVDCEAIIIASIVDILLLLVLVVLVVLVVGRLVGTVRCYFD
jgi:hypothetical protein